MSQGLANLQQLLVVHSTELWPVEKRSTYNSSDLFGSGGRSLNGSSGIHDACVGHILGGVRRQVRTLSCRRGIDVRLLVFQPSWLSIAVTQDLVS